MNSILSIGFLYCRCLFAKIEVGGVKWLKLHFIFDLVKISCLLRGKDYVRKYLFIVIKVLGIDGLWTDGLHWSIGLGPFDLYNYI